MCVWAAWCEGRGREVRWSGLSGEGCLGSCKVASRRVVAGWTRGPKIQFPGPHDAPLVLHGGPLALPDGPLVLHDASLVVHDAPLVLHDAQLVIHDVGR